jgi:hypothetical protein
MTRRLFAVTACCVLLSTASMLAQARGAKADPVSGTWKGELDVPNAPAPVAITMELKFDGKTAVTGTFSGLPNPGEVKRGTFNSKTGALKLELGKKGGSEVLLVLDGTAVKGTASGNVTGEGGTGKFKIAKKATNVK